MALFRDFCDIFITINSHILKWKFSRGLTREIHENITMYTVVSKNAWRLFFLCSYNDI